MKCSKCSEPTGTELVKVCWSCRVEAAKQDLMDAEAAEKGLADFKKNGGATIDEIKASLETKH